jgi:ABC-type sulfate transport system permease subunit
VQRPRHGRVRRRVGGLGPYSGVTNTVPLQVEILYNEYDFVGAFAVASLLTLLALVTLIIKKLVEHRQASLDDGRKA